MNHREYQPVIKVFENCASREIESTTTVLLTDASHDDNPEMVTMRSELTEMKALAATLGSTSIPTVTTGDVHTGKRARVHNNGKTTVSKVVITSTVCKKNGHNTHGCWFNSENKVKEVTKMKRDTEDILKSKKNNKKTLISGFSPNEHNDECLNCVSLKCYHACADTCHAVFTISCSLLCARPSVCS